MIKTYTVTGVNWTAEVNIDNLDSVVDSDFHVEAATRAVEARFGKRSDISISYHKPIKLTKKQKNQFELQAALFELLTEELVDGCGIGNLLCVIDTEPNGLKQLDNEWYVSSKLILANAGIPKLVNRFNEKYPDGKPKTN